MVKAVEIWDDEVKGTVKLTIAPTKPGGNRTERRKHLSSRAYKKQLRKERLEKQKEADNEQS